MFKNYQKLLSLFLAIVLCLSLATGCTPSNKTPKVDKKPKTYVSTTDAPSETAKEDIPEETKEEVEDEKPIEESQIEETSSQKTVYGIGDVWEVEGQWSVKIDSVKTTSYRNPYEESEPAQVVIVTYTYENLGYESDYGDLFIFPDRAIDSGKKMAETYPADTSVYAKETPVGAICEGAEEAFGLLTESDEITIIFEKYDNDLNLQKATFVIPVEPEE